MAQSPSRVLTRAEALVGRGDLSGARQLLAEAVQDRLGGKATRLLTRRARSRLLPAWAPVLARWAEVNARLGAADDRALILALALLGPLREALTEDERAELRITLRKTPWMLSPRAATALVRALRADPETVMRAAREMAVGGQVAGFELCRALLEQREGAKVEALRYAGGWPRDAFSQEAAIVGARAAALAGMRDRAAGALAAWTLAARPDEARVLGAYVEADDFDYRVQDLYALAEDLTGEEGRFVEEVQQRIDRGALMAARRLCEAVLIRRLAPGAARGAGARLPRALLRLRGAEKGRQHPVTLGAARQLGVLMALTGDAGQEAVALWSFLLSQPEHRTALGTEAVGLLTQSLGRADGRRAEAASLRLERGAAEGLDADEQETLQALEQWLHRGGEPERDELLGLIPMPMLEGAVKGVDAAMRALNWGAERLTDRDEVLRAMADAGVHAGFDALRFEHLAQLDRVAEPFLGHDRRLAAATAGLWGMGGVPGMVANLPALVLVCFRSAARIALCYGIDVGAVQHRGLPLEAMLHAVGAPQAALAWNSMTMVEANPDETRLVVGGMRYAVESLSVEGLRYAGGASALRALVLRLAAYFGVAPGSRRMARVLPVIGAVAGAAGGYTLLTDVNKAAFNVSRWRFLLRKAQAAGR